MKSYLLSLILAVALVIVCGKSIAGNTNGKSSGLKSDGDTMTVENALANRYSERRYDPSKTLADAQILKLLWAANGVNKYGRRTAPSAMNAQDIDLYVCKANGTWKYNAEKKRMDEVTNEDIRPYFIEYNDYANDAPLCILLITDQSKFSEPTEAGSERNKNFGLIDAGIVSENISLYCTSVGLGTVPCAPHMENAKIQKALGLTEKQVPILYHPVGYPAK
jgi:nitroreductase